MNTIMFILVLNVNYHFLLLLVAKVCFAVISHPKQRSSVAKHKRMESSLRGLVGVVHCFNV